MAMDRFIETVANWSWPVRLGVSLIFLVPSVLFLLMGRVWIWGWIGAAILLVGPVIYNSILSSDPILDAKVNLTAEDLQQTVTTVELDPGRLEAVLRHLVQALHPSFDAEKMQAALTCVQRLAAGRTSRFSYHIRTQTASSPLNLTVKRTAGDAYAVSFGTRPELHVAIREALVQNGVQLDSAPATGAAAGTVAGGPPPA